MNIHWPQIVWLLWAVLSILFAFGAHRKARSPRNGFKDISVVLVTFGLLYFGGFFSA